MYPALAVLEIDTLPRALTVQDATLKRASVTYLACAPVSGGKVVLAFCGPVAEVQEAYLKGVEVAGSFLVDHVFLPAAHAGVQDGLLGKRCAEPCESLLAIECQTVCACIVAADAALKTADVTLGRMHLASGFAGRAFFTLHGSLPDLEAALEAAAAQAGDKVLSREIIASPHESLLETTFVRPWAASPIGE